MICKFSKYQGTGNDFILIDNRDLKFSPTPKQVSNLCDRKFGIGADGLILIENHPSLDYQMIYFNSDGTQSLCGNGSRCGFAFARSLGIVDNNATFETTDGIHQIKLENGLVHFQLFDVASLKKENADWYVNTGSPHYIKIIEDTEAINVVEEGRSIRNLPTFSRQNGTNVNFAQLLQDGVKIRTYERGVEDETLSCGTGATAVAIVAGELGQRSPIKIKTRGGDLFVSFKKKGDTFSDIWLAGPAEKVFEGTITF